MPTQFYAMDGLVDVRNSGNAFDAQGERMEFFGLHHFAGHVNESFDVLLDDEGRAPFVLVEARPLPAPAMGSSVRAPFSLLFRNASAILFPQKVYAMKHASLGQFGIFLVPIARDRDGFIYQAVFN